MSASVDRGMAWIEGGGFRMGCDRFYREEMPVHALSVGRFWIDRHPVTVRDFRRFAENTGYVSLAERAPDPSM
jgi:formylglycine-generating enzyme